MLKDTKILYIEDEISIRVMTEKLLLKRGAHVTSATNGKEGLEFARVNSFDIIISDIQMPGMNGIEMVRHIREEGIKTPVIVVSAHNETEYLDALKHLNIEAVLNKPINLREFLECIERLTSK